MKTHQDHKTKAGGVLVMVMVVLVAFSILAISMFKLNDVDALEAVYVENAQRAFWMAESGLDHLIRDLTWNPSARTVSHVVATNYNAMSYTGKVAEVVNGPFIDSKLFTIESVGVARDAVRTLRYQILTTPGADASIVLKGGDSSFDSNNDIYDPVIMFGGTIDTGNNDTSTFHDYILGDANNITGGGDVAGMAEPPFPFDEPTLDPSGYNAQVDAVVVDGSPPTTNGNTITFHTANVSLTTPVPDGTTLIVPGTIDFGNNHADIGSGVTILAGDDIFFPGHSDIDPNTLVYAKENIEFRTHSNAEDTSLIGVTLLTSNGDVTFKSHVTFEGLIFADNGTVYLGAGADIMGSIIGGVGLDKSATGNAGISSVLIRYDPDVFMKDLPVALNMGGLVVVRKQAGTWEEL